MRPPFVSCAPTNRSGTPTHPGGTVEVAQCKITPHLWHTCTVQDLQKSATFVSGSHLIPHGFHPMRFYKQSAPTIWGNIRAFHQLGLKHHLLNFLDTKFDCRHM